MTSDAILAIPIMIAFFLFIGIPLLFITLYSYETVESYTIDVGNFSKIHIEPQRYDRVVLKGQILKCMNVSDTIVLGPETRVYANENVVLVDEGSNAWRPVNGTGKICIPSATEYTVWTPTDVYAAGTVTVERQRATCAPTLIFSGIVLLILAILLFLRRRQT